MTIHKESQTKLDELAQSSLERCGPLWLKQRIESVFQDPLLRDCVGKEKVEVLLAHTPFWKKARDALARREAPIALAHADPGLVCIVAPYGSMMLHDWGLSCLSAPFHDIVALCWPVMREMAKEDPGATRKDPLAVIDTEYCLKKREAWRPLPDLKLSLKLSSHAFCLHCMAQTANDLVISRGCAIRCLFANSTEELQKGWSRNPWKASTLTPWSARCV